MSVAKEEKILPPGWSPQPKASFEVGEWVDFTQKLENVSGGPLFTHALAEIIEIKGLAVVVAIDGSRNEQMTFAPRHDGTYIRITHPDQLKSIPDFAPDNEDFPTKIHRGSGYRRLSSMKAKFESDRELIAKHEASKPKLLRIINSIVEIMRER